MHLIRQVSPMGAALALGLMATPALAGASMTPTMQQRTLNSFVMVPPCAPPSIVSDNDAAATFAPFDSQVNSEQICDFAQAVASAGQLSTIGATELTASGSTFASVASTPSFALHAICSSVFQVKFSLDQAANLRFTGEVSSGGGPILIPGQGRVRLLDARGADLLQASASPGPGGAMSTAKVDETVHLQPGAYTLYAAANSGIDSMVPPAGSGGSTYVARLMVLDPADLDHDGDVDGMDLASLLAHWGGCPLACLCCCPADFDCSGATDGLDLAQLLAAWTP